MIITVAVIDVPAGKPLAVRVNDQLTVAVCEFGGSYHAFDSRCPHRGGRLTEGEVAGELIVCPAHHFKFSLRTGRCLMPRHLKLRSFPARREDGELKIELEVEEDATRPI